MTFKDSASGKMFEVCACVRFVVFLHDLVGEGMCMSKLKIHILFKSSPHSSFTFVFPKQAFGKASVLLMTNTQALMLELLCVRCRTLEISHTLSSTGMNTFRTNFYWMGNNSEESRF